MNAAPFERYRLLIEPISPIHIGSGTSIEPYEYDLVEQDGSGWLVALDLNRMLNDLSDRERAEFDQVLAKGDFPGVRAWLRQHADHGRHRRFAVVVQPHAFKELCKHQDNPERLGEIELFTRHAASGRPYIPGSSIKGAIRTALVDAAALAGDQRELERVARGPQSERSSALFEAHALGYLDRSRARADLRRDPLRQIAISDAALPDDACYIDIVRIVRPVNDRGRARPTGDAGIVMYRDVTWSILDQEPIEAVADFRLLRGLTDAGLMRGDRLPVAWSVADLVRLCNDYYVEEIERQLDVFTPSESNHIRRPLLHVGTTLEPNQCIIRVGRHSHWECVVVSSKFNRPPRRGYGKSRTYVGGELPLGWARLTFQPAP